MDHPSTPFDHWPPRLDAALRDCPLLRRVHVLWSVDSTQDAARRLGARAGDVFVAWQQTAGRGRLGRRWIDGGEDAIALTAVIDAPPSAALAIAPAVAVARVIEMGRTIAARCRARYCVPSDHEGLPESRLAPRIKWPNDVLLHDRKLAGILIERVDARSLIGIGINVNQLTWPPEIVDRATSLRRALGPGTPALDRLPIIEHLLPALDHALAEAPDALAAAFMRHDCLVGRAMRFAVAGRGEIAARVIELDPLRGLRVDPLDGGGTIWLPAETTSVIGPVETPIAASSPTR